MDAIDRALQDVPGEPSSRFHARVMSAVRREAATPPPLRFPWGRLVAGLVASVLWLVLGWRALTGGAEGLAAFTRSGPVLGGVALLLTLSCLRFVRFCLRA